VRVLVVNAGSSSLKVRLLGHHDDIIFSSDLPPIKDGSGHAGLSAALARAGPVDAVGHRIVHGGTRFRAGCRVDGAVVESLRALVDLAPLHQPASLSAMDAVSRELPDVPAVVCFDTAFHSTLSPGASTYAVPARWRREFGVRRYGFHGLSHSYVAQRVAQMLGRSPQGLRIVSCHLGAGASLAAIRDGVCLDTTMGFTPLEGLVMATRSGTVDPGLVLWLLEHRGLSPKEISDALENRSGLAALAGTAEMGAVVAAADNGARNAMLAVDVYVHRLSASIAAMAVAIGGLDVLVFTGGVGENAPSIRQRTVERLGFLGIEIDPDRNRRERPDADVTASGTTVRCLVVESREDIQIAAEVRRVLGAGADPPR
jgi:acetate kinase